MDIKRKQLLCVLFIVLLTRIVYQPAFTALFVNWDDNIYITENTLVRSLSFDSLKKTFTSFHYGLYKPLVIVSFALEYQLFGLNPHAFHVTNVTLHILNTILVFLLFLRICNNTTVATTTAFLFGIHPFHVESVAWVTERKDMLYALFFLSSFLMYILSRKKTNHKFYMYSLLLFILSLLSKPMAVTFPLLLLLWEYFQGGSEFKKALVRIIPFTLIACGIAVLNWYGLHSHAHKTSFPLAFSFDSIFIASHGILFYLKKTFWPLELCAFYPYPIKINGMFPTIFYWAPYTVVFLLTGIALSLKYTKKILFGSFFFLITIAPVLFLGPCAPGVFAADRYTYISLLGIFYLIGEIISWLLQKKTCHKSIVRAGILTLSGILTITLSFLTFQRVQIWKNSESLWKDTLRKNPHLLTAHLQLSSFYLVQKNLPLAQRYAQKARALAPNSWKPYLLLGNIALANENIEGAIANYEQSLEYEEIFLTYNNLGSAYRALKQYDIALDYYKKAYALKEDCFLVDINIAEIYSIKGMREKALPILSRFSKLSIQEIPYSIKIAGCYFYLHDYAKAEEILNNILLIDNASWPALTLLSLVYKETGDSVKSTRMLHRARAINPQVDGFIAMYQ